MVQALEPTSAHATSTPTRRYQIDLDIRNRRPIVRIGGEFSRLAADSVHALIESLHQIRATVHLVMTDVTEVEPAALALLLDAAHRRNVKGLPPVVVTAASPIVLTALSSLGIRDEPPVELQG